MRAIAKAQPNIALIKYWGKRDRIRNLPAVGSISVTLSDLFTEMDVEIDETLKDDVLVVNGQDGNAMLARVSSCLDNVVGQDRPAARSETGQATRWKENKVSRNRALDRASI